MHRILADIGRLQGELRYTHLKYHVAMRGVLSLDQIATYDRLRGYDSFPVEIRPFRASNVPDDPQWLTARRVRDALVGAGLLEARPMPFVPGADRGFVKVANPLAENEAYLRRDILDTLARRAEYNVARMQGDVRLFEIGAVFSPMQGALPHEELHVGAVIMGRRRPAHFSDPKTAEFEHLMTFDAWDAKALAEFATQLGDDFTATLPPVLLDGFSRAAARLSAR